MKIYKPEGHQYDQIKDLFGRVALKAPSNQFNWNSEGIEDEIQHSEFLVLETDERLVSFISYRETDDSAEIMALGTDSSYTGRGFMEKLLMEFVAKHHKASRQVFLEVHADNAAAIKVYMKVGFKLSRVRSGYYSDGKDALVFVG